ncbi:MAG: RNA polymerase sigma factor [Chloroflexota bacterium]
MNELAIGGGVGTTVVSAAAAGDADALTLIVRAHHDDMARLCFVICGDADLAQDAVQAAWPIAWRRLSSLRDPGQLRPWLMSVAANEARQLLRARRRRPSVPIHDVVAPALTGDPALDVELTDLALALARLSPDDRALISLRYVAGFDATEIGRALRISPSGVRTRLSRVLARLRTELDHG